MPVVAKNTPHLKRARSSPAARLKTKTKTKSKNKEKKRV